MPLPSHMEHRPSKVPNRAVRPGNSDGREVLVSKRSSQSSIQLRTPGGFTDVSVPIATFTSTAADAAEFDRGHEGRTTRARDPEPARRSANISGHCVAAGSSGRQHPTPELPLLLEGSTVVCLPDADSSSLRRTLRRAPACPRRSRRLPARGVRRIMRVRVSRRMPQYRGPWTASGTA
jgi:hypothetical protein